MRRRRFRWRCGGCRSFGGRRCGGRCFRARIHNDWMPWSRRKRRGFENHPPRCCCDFHRRQNVSKCDRSTSVVVSDHGSHLRRTTAAMHSRLCRFPDPSSPTLPVATPSGDNTTPPRVRRRERKRRETNASRWFVVEFWRKFWWMMLFSLRWISGSCLVGWLSRERGEAEVV